MRLDSQAITILILLLAVIYMGLLERVLERMRLTGRQAMFILLAIILGEACLCCPYLKDLKSMPAACSFLSPLLSTLSLPQMRELKNQVPFYHTCNRYCGLGF